MRWKTNFIAATRGFTLIELLVVVAIVGVLSSVVLAAMNSARVKSRDARRKSEIHQIKNALELYYDDNSTYPPARLADGAAIADNTGGNLINTVTFDLAVYLKSPVADPSAPTYNYSYVRAANHDGYGIRVYEESNGAYCKTGINVLTSWWGASVLACN